MRLGQLQAQQVGQGGQKEGGKEFFYACGSFRHSRWGIHVPGCASDCPSLMYLQPGQISTAVQKRLRSPLCPTKCILVSTARCQHGQAHCCVQ